jgi:carbon storage regulator
MLVLTRKVGEKIVIDDQIIVKVVEIKGNQIRLGFEAPLSVTIKRAELAGLENDSPGRLREVTAR